MNTLVQSPMGATYYGSPELPFHLILILLAVKKFLTWIFKLQKFEENNLYLLSTALHIINFWVWRNFIRLMPDMYFRYEMGLLRECFPLLILFEQVKGILQLVLLRV